MTARPLRVVCYVNQFFGQLGGEEKDGVGPQVAEGAVGAARAVQQALGAAGTVVATVICGDNYAAEQPERAEDDHVQERARGLSAVHAPVDPHRDHAGEGGRGGA